MDQLLCARTPSPIFLLTMKYLVVTGGVVSGLGKGITISSIGVLLKSAGLRVTSIKIDPYLVRPWQCVSAMSPLATLPPCALQRSLHLPNFRLPACTHLALQNSDAGTMSPFEHGEVFVLNDGGEVRPGSA